MHGKILQTIYKRSKEKIFHLYFKEIELIKFGNEEAPYNKNTGYFHIGDKDQTPEDYDKEIKDKINSIVDYNIAWNFTIEYIRKFPKEVLLDQKEFYKNIYESIRDKFFEELLKNK